MRGVNESDERGIGCTPDRRTLLRGGAVALGAAAGLGRGAGATETASGRRRSYGIMEGTESETEVVVYEADAAGPTTLVTGGIHGSEAPGYEAAERIAR